MALVTSEESFWLGKEKTHQMTEIPSQLRVEINTMSAGYRYTNYSNFTVTNEAPWAEHSVPQGSPPLGGALSPPGLGSPPLGGALSPPGQGSPPLGGALSPPGQGSPPLGGALSPPGQGSQKKHYK